MYMRFKGSAFLCLFMIMIAVGVFINALQWPMTTALFPIILSILFFLLAVAELCFTLFGKEIAVKNTIDFKLSEDIEKAIVNRRTLLTFLWIIGFFLMIFFFGMTIAIPIFIFSYLKFYGRENWNISIIFAGLAWGFFFGLFVWLLNTTLPEGWILTELRALGML